MMAGEKKEKKENKEKKEKKEKKASHPAGNGYKKSI